MKCLVAGVVCSMLALATAADAQQAPPYATTFGSDAIRGVILAFDGAYKLQVADERGFVDNVELHDGTIIAPRGRRLNTGMPVIVRGVPAGAQFDALAIQTYVDPTATPSMPYFDDQTGSWQGYNRYGCTNAPAPPIHSGAADASWRYGPRC